jgi:Acyl-CoA dehydrogenase, C-terminal domain
MAEGFWIHSKRLGSVVIEHLGGLRMEDLLTRLDSYDGANDVQDLSDWLTNEGIFDAQALGFGTVLNICRGVADHSVGLAAAAADNMCVPSAILRSLSDEQAANIFSAKCGARIVSVAHDAEATFSFDKTGRLLSWEAPIPVVNLTRASHCILPIVQNNEPQWAIVPLDSIHVNVSPLHQTALPELGLGYIKVNNQDVSQAVFTTGADVLNMALVSKQLIGSVLAMYLAYNSLDACIVFVRHRDFGKGRLSQQQAIQHKIANLQAELMISGNWLDCALKDYGRSASLPVEQAAAVCSAVLRSTREVVEGARQLLGGRGFLLDFPVSSAGLQLTALKLLIGQVEALEARVSCTLWGAPADA